MKSKLSLIILLILSLFIASELFAETVEVNLKEGWNLISVPLDLETSGVSQAFLSIDGKYRDVWGYDSSDVGDPWKHYHPLYPSFSDLNTIELNHGYWIYSDGEVTLTLIGSSVLSEQVIALNSGWNLIGWPYQYELPIDIALSSLEFGVDYNQLAVYEAGFGWRNYFNSSATDDFDTLEPAKAYYIYCLRPCTLSLAANHPPELNLIGNQTVKEGEELVLEIRASDADEGGNLDYFASNLPKGASFDPETRRFSWTPEYTQQGQYTGILFEVFDGIFTDQEYISITVQDVNQPPLLNPIGNQSIKEGRRLEFKVSSQNIDGDDLTYRVTNIPEGASFEPDTQNFSWTPSLTQAGTYPGVHLEVTDGTFVDSEDITIIVLNSNQSPVLEDIPEQSVTENEEIVFTMQAQDPDGDSLEYMVYGLPSGADFDFEKLRFTWKPSHNDIGRKKIIFCVSDGELITAQSVTILVNSINQVQAFGYLDERFDGYFSEGDRLVANYEKALAIVTFLSRGLPEDIGMARAIVEELIDVGDREQGGIEAGDMAWMITSILQYYRYSGDGDVEFLNEILAGAKLIGNLIIEEFWDKDESGFFIDSTKDNISLYVAFMHLYDVTGDSVWRDKALWLSSYVVSKFNGAFFTVVSRDDYVEYANSWALLALGGGKDFEKVIWWVEDNMALAHNGFRGFDFNDDKDSVWFEATSHMALAYQLVGRIGSSYFYCDELRRAQREAIGGNGKAIVANSYPDSPPDIASTCWFILAERALNPFWGTATDEPIPMYLESSIESQGLDDRISPPYIYPIHSPTNIPVQTIRGRKDASTSIWLNGREIVLEGEEYFSYTFLLQEGENTFRFTARNSGGRESTPITVTILLDTTAPTITITSPKDGFLTKNSSIIVSGNTTQDVVLVEVNARLATISNSNFTADRIWLIEGRNSIVATVRDLAGNIAQDVIIVTLDTTPPHPPEISAFSSPTNMRELTISGTKESNSSIWLNGTEIIPLDAQAGWSYRISLREGNNNLSFTSKDELGNESKPTEVNIVLDTIQPDRPTIDAVDSPTNIKTQTITGTRSIDTNEIMLSSQEALTNSINYPTQTTWSAMMTLKEGSNKLTVFAKDEAGNIARGDGVTITLDTTPPLFRVEYPADGSYISGKE